MVRRKGNDGGRRKRGTGSAWVDKTGQAWYEYADEYNRKHRHRAASLEAAEVALDSVNAAKAEGLRPADGSQSLADFLELWLNRELVPAVENGELKASTLEHNKYLIEHYILPYIGNYAVNTITTPQLVDLRNLLRKRPLVVQTVNSVLALLSRALRDAVAWRLIKVNPAGADNLRRAKQPPKEEKNPPTEAQMRALVSVAAEHRLVGALYVAATLGLRIGEIFGLRWQDIDWDKAEIRIERQVQQRRGIDPPGATIYGSLRVVPPKTAAGKRTLPIPPRLFAILQARRQEWLEEQRMDGWKEHGFIFPSERGTPMNIRNFEGVFYRWRTAAGWPRTMNFHKLRSLTATLLSESGAQDVIQRAILGHGKANVTQRYQAARMPAMRAALVAVEQALWGDEQEQERVG